MREYRGSSPGAWRRRRLQGFDYSDPNAVYFVTICAAGDSRPFKDDALCAIVVDSLNWLRENRGIFVYAYCLMPDHAHLLIRLGGQSKTLGDVVGAMKRFTTKQSWKLGHRGELWQSRFYDHILRSNEDVDAVIEYILANPVRKGIVATWEEYRWSAMPDPTR